MLSRSAFRTMLFALFLSGTIAQAHQLVVFLYDQNNKPLGHGDAILMVEHKDRDIEKEWTIYVGKSTSHPYYVVDLPSTDYYNLVVHTDNYTRRRDIDGIYGHVSHQLHLKASSEFTQTCGAYETAYGVPSDSIQLLDQLDRAFPNGVPHQKSNIREFLKQGVLQPLDEEGVPDDPEVSKEYEAFRQRVMRHLQD
jgi:hypothetical protein